MISLIRYSIVLLLVASVLAVGRGGGPFAACVASTTQDSPKITASDLKKLRWIEGTWRGTGDNVQPFFERYRFENDTTLAVDTFEDDKLEKVTDTTRYELRNGEFAGGNEGFRWAASAIDEKSVTFSPVAKARNSFRWENVDKDSWKATINWPANEDKPARERIYKMERWPPKSDF